jgi:hypothetical protein
MVQQQFENRHAARARRHHQRGLAVAESLVGVGAGFEQLLDEIGVARLARQRQRGDPGIRPDRRIGARRDQRRGGLRVAVVRRPVQSGRAIGLRGIDVRLRRNEPFQPRRVVLHHRIGDLTGRIDSDAAERSPEDQQLAEGSATRHARILARAVPGETRLQQFLTVWPG